MGQMNCAFKVPISSDESETNLKDVRKDSNFLYHTHLKLGKMNSSQRDHFKNILNHALILTFIYEKRAFLR